MFVRKSISIPIYVGNLDIILMDGVDEFNSLYYYNFRYSDMLYAHAIETVFKENNKTSFVVVFNPKNKLGRLSHGVIAHEALHITSYVLDKVGQKFKHSNHEDFAYLLQWIVDEMYTFFKENKIKIHV